MMRPLALVALLSLTACHHEPQLTSAQIEALGMTAQQQNAPSAELRLLRLAAQGVPVAQRELGILYRARPTARMEAQRLLLLAAQAGDAQAAFHLGELYHTPAAGFTPDAAAAWPWYQRAAEGGQARAALMLGLMAKNGDGTVRDAAVAARWLTLASELGNAHAMFLLSNAYRAGEGVARDDERATLLLEEAAEHDYPPALQELALRTADPTRASHLMKEATEHRRNSWNRF